jgi:hypothetical protein
MFKGLLNRVRIDLVRACLNFSIWGPINRQRRLTGGVDQVSVHL